MYFITVFTLSIILIDSCVSQWTQNEMNLRVDAGTRNCFYEYGKSGQVLETQYQVIDGQHGDLDISFEVHDPKGVKLASDYKKTENSVIIQLEVDGEYEFCLDNTHSIMNSKLVYMYVMIEDETNGEIKENVEDETKEDGDDKDEVVEWRGINVDGETYYVTVAHITDSLTRTLKSVVKARHLMDLYSAVKSRDSYMAFEDTFIVDVWSAFQISFMIIVGIIQVYMIKKLFRSPNYGLK